MSFLSLSLVRSSIDLVLSAEAISAKSPETSLSSFKFKIVSDEPFKSVSFQFISFFLKYYFCFGFINGSFAVGLYFEEIFVFSAIAFIQKY